MNRRYVIVGVLMALVGLLFAYESGQQFLSNLSNQNNTVTSELLVYTNATKYLHATLNSTSLFALDYNSTTPINFYLANASGFQAMLPYLNSTVNLSREANALQGNGIFAIIANSPTGSYPYEASYAQLFPKPNYTYNSTLIPAGSYYMIFRDANSLDSDVFYSYYIRSASGISFTNNSSFGFGIVSGLLIVIGIALIFFSFFMKPPPKEPKAADAQIDEMYKQIEKKSKRTRRRTSKRKR